MGVVFAYHGYLKLIALDKTSGFLGTLGFPTPDIMAILLMLVEFVGGLMLIIGLLTRLVALLQGIDMIVAVLLVHLKKGFLVSQGGYEFAALLLFACISLIISGSGPLSIDKKLIEKST